MKKRFITTEAAPSMPTEPSCTTKTVGWKKENPLLLVGVAALKAILLPSTLPREFGFYRNTKEDQELHFYKTLKTQIFIELRTGEKLVPFSVPVSKRLSAAELQTLFRVRIKEQYSELTLQNLENKRIICGAISFQVYSLFKIWQAIQECVFRGNAFHSKPTSSSRTSISDGLCYLLPKIACKSKSLRAKISASVCCRTTTG